MKGEKKNQCNGERLKVLYQGGKTILASKSIVSLSD